MLVKHHLDKKKRESLQRFIDEGELKICSGCGGDMEGHTLGCSRCTDRHKKRNMDPETRSRQNQLTRLRRKKKRQSVRAANT